MNLSNTIKRLSVPLSLVKVTTTIVNHVPTETEVISNIKAVVQPADKDKINKDKLDYTLKYIQVNNLEEILINDIVEYKGIRYKAFENADYTDYGYYESIMEQIKWY